jgi:hypothetical protein
VAGRCSGSWGMAKRRPHADCLSGNRSPDEGVELRDGELVEAVEGR